LEDPPRDRITPRYSPISTPNAAPRSIEASRRSRIPCSPAPTLGISAPRVPEEPVRRRRNSHRKGVIWVCRWPRPLGGTPILIRTGKRRSADVIMSRGLPGMDVPYLFGTLHAPGAMSSGLSIWRLHWKAATGFMERSGAGRRVESDHPDCVVAIPLTAKRPLKVFCCPTNSFAGRPRLAPPWGFPAQSKAWSNDLLALRGLTW